MHLDLHEKHIHQAWKDTIAFIDYCAVNKIRKFTIITGRSGQIREEFLLWLEPKNHLFSSVKLNENKDILDLYLRKKYK